MAKVDRQLGFVAWQVDLARSARLSLVIAPEDRVTYAEARRITARSHMYLYKLVKQGHLSREGSGQKGRSVGVFLSRSEVEALALAEYVRGQKTDYWLTVREAAEMFGIDGQTVRTGGFPTLRAGNGDLLLRREDVDRVLRERSWRTSRRRTRQAD